jgi:predicted metal-dependent phosphoesterase TrpH
VVYHALTDHDSTEGIAEARRAAAKHTDYKLIPGVEMGTDIEGAEVHMIGLFLSPDDPELQDALKRLRDGRVGRGFGIVEKLRAMGITIEWERVQQIAGDASVGRPHIAQALVEAGHVSRVSEAFDRWIGRNGPAYVERDKMTPADAVRFIVERGGIACMAHPAEVPGFETLLPELKAAGTSAMEVYYKDYSAGTVERLRLEAEKHGFLPLGGSDYHGIFGADEPLPGQMHVPLPDSSIERLLEMASRLPNRELAV